MLFDKMLNIFHRKKTESNIPGWFHSNELYNLAVQFSHNSSVFIELGSFYGKSTVYMAELIKKSKKPIKFYAIDTWEWDEWMDDESFLIGFSVEEKKEFAFINKLYNKDMPNIINHYLDRYDVQNYVELIKSDSVLAANKFDDGSVDFIYLDTGHTYNRIKNEISAWLPKIRKGGLIGGDDFDRDDHKDGGVSRAVIEFSNNDFITDGVTWYFFNGKV